MEIVAEVIARLQAMGATVATAESCSGGLAGAAFTSVPGASHVYPGGVVAYANAIKEEWLGVSASLLATEGAVSAAVAVAMAEGVRRRFKSDWGVSTTGIAGPGGATPDKPVGLVFLAVAGPERSLVERHLFSGDREAVRRQSVTALFKLLLTALGGG